jgi:hypothetical protein
MGIEITAEDAESAERTGRGIRKRDLLPIVLTRF